MLLLNRKPGQNLFIGDAVMCVTSIGHDKKGRYVELLISFSNGDDPIVKRMRTQEILVVRIRKNVEIHILQIQRLIVKIGIEAPKSIDILREEAKERKPQ